MKRDYLHNIRYLLIMCFGLLNACTTFDKTECQYCTSNNNQTKTTNFCLNAGLYEGKVIGDGHCVSLIKYCSNAPNTDQWYPGEIVWQNEIKPGSIIATFKNNRYPNITGYHAAIYISQDASGIWVWDQWQGKPVHKRLIRWRNDGATNNNTAQSYRTVLWLAE